MVCATWSKPTFWSITAIKARDATAITIHGTHQREFRRRPLKVLLGARNILRRRCASDNAGGAVCGAAAGIELINEALSASKVDSSCQGDAEQQPALSSQHSPRAVSGTREIPSTSLRAGPSRLKAAQDDSIENVEILLS